MMYDFSAVQKDPAEKPGLLFFIQRRAARGKCGIRRETAFFICGFFLRYFSFAAH